jgi:hypothetical protein
MYCLLLYKEGAIRKFHCGCGINYLILALFPKHIWHSLIRIQVRHSVMYTVLIFPSVILELKTSYSFGFNDFHFHWDVCNSVNFNTFISTIYESYFFNWCKYFITCYSSLKKFIINWTILLQERTDTITSSSETENKYSCKLVTSTMPIVKSIENLFTC